MATSGARALRPWTRYLTFSELRNKLERGWLQQSCGFCSATKPESEDLALELWMWGRGEAGQLGLSEENTERSPSPMRSMSLPKDFRLSPMAGLLLPSPKFQPHQVGSKEPHPLEVAASTGLKWSRNYSGVSMGGGIEEVGIACGLFHSCLWKNGDLWLWGKGDGGRLGTGSEVSLYSPYLNPSLSGVKSVALGGLHSAVVTEEGDVYTFGFGGFGALGHGSYEKVVTPKHVDGRAVGMEKIVHIAAGGAHTAAVSAAGDVFTWGRDEGEGRLGHIPGPQYEDGVPVPVQVRGISDPIAAVACGGFFTMALTSEGQLWSWGGSSNYELGRGDRRASWKPSAVPAVEGIRLVQVACGGYHSAALTEDGKVLTWGHGGHGQLGHGDLANVKVPKVVEALGDHKVVFIACGGAWTTAVTENGDLFTWGKNRDCQLGVQGLMDTEMLPILVTLTPDDEQVESGYQAIAVAAGAHHGGHVDKSRSDIFMSSTTLSTRMEEEQSL